MEGDRNRVPCDPDYINAIGTASFCFTRCEWDALWCGEKLSPGFIESAKTKTAGVIAKQLMKLAEAVETSKPHRDELVSAAEEFCRLVKERNAIVHGRPFTWSDKSQRISNRELLGGWTIESLQKAADDFTACSLRLNNLLHRHL